jgi:drug/metabolite transporter (DMT)-like permease
MATREIQPRIAATPMAPRERGNIRATWIGLTAIVLWASNALLISLTEPIPPFQLMSLAFAIGGAIGTGYAVARNEVHAYPTKWYIWLVSVGGLFGYHALYIGALRIAPPAEVNVVNYFWPLLVVIFSSLLPDERLRLRYIAGVLIGLSGVIALFVGRTGGIFAMDRMSLLGYLLALLGAVIWATYCVASRAFKHVPTAAVSGFCLVTAILAFICHISFESTVWPSRRIQWLAIAGIGIGPLGLAFYVWDYGVKHGNIQLLSTASYTTAILSTVLLILAGFAQLSWGLGVACAAIVAGTICTAGRWYGRRG